jgi:uncharacterized protein
MVEAILKSETIIARALNVKESQVQSAIDLLDAGATVPFIARYRKEATQGLDDTQLRFIAERLYYLRELSERRAVILNSIREQEKLTPELEQLIITADTKTRLEDLYLPYRPKRRTKAALAIAAGLEPLALGLLADPTRQPLAFAAEFINAENDIANAETALEGAEHILMEHFAEDAKLLDTLREYIWQHGILASIKNKSAGSNKKKDVAHKYADYFAYSEPLKKIPSHRALALFRGRRENALQLSLTLPEGNIQAEQYITQHFNISDQKRSADTWLMDIVTKTWKLKLFPKLELELYARLRESADEEAIQVFAGNVKDLLLAAPAGPQVTLGLDPGIRTGVKAVVVDITGKLLDYTTVYPFAPQNDWHPAIADLAKLASKYQVNLISIGNGTGSRETERLVADMIKMYPDLPLTKVLVSEAGASVYSASELAAAEFPDIDVSIRGAVSIARRLQDPLAELVKIEPKSIGVGQYQHDVNQPRLARSLTGVVEDCVNAVGVDVNTASVALLTRVAGLNETLAKNVVEYRDINGVFTNREQLKLVSRMGEKTFQQAAGFLRIMQGDNPLDASAVHPEAYPIVEKIIGDLQTDIKQLIGNKSALQSINAEKYVDPEHGLITLRDILAELEKPGRDPRPEFKTASFKEGVEDIAHLEVGMILEGIVSNVTNFGAFVDIGVHQDGLVHISSMTNRFIKDPRDIVKAGDVVKVKVLEVDKARRRIGLSMKLEEITPIAVKKAAKAPEQKTSVQPIRRAEQRKKPEALKKVEQQKKPPVFNTAMADALAGLKRGKSS